METIVNKRPKKFKTVNDGVDWAIKSRTLLNRESAKVSIPPQLVEKAMPPNNQMAWTWSRAGQRLSLTGGIGLRLKIWPINPSDS